MCSKQLHMRNKIGLEMAKVCESQQNTRSFPHQRATDTISCFRNRDMGDLHEHKAQGRVVRVTAGLWPSLSTPTTHLTNVDNHDTPVVKTA